MRSPSSFWRKRPFISMNSSASIENLSSSERARARARANHANNDAQKGCAMQLNGITLKPHLSMKKKINKKKERKEKTRLGGIKTMIFLSWNKTYKIPKIILLL